MIACNALAVSTMLAVHGLNAVSMPVPVKLQGVLFKKIFFYDETLKAEAAGEVHVLVAHAAGDARDASSVVEAFVAVSVRASAIPVSSLERALTKESVVYVFPKADVKKIKALCAAKKVLSVGGRPALVEAGDISVGLGVREDGRPQIIIHLERVKAEGHELNSRLLGLAKVIR